MVKPISNLSISFLLILLFFFFNNSKAQNPDNQGFIYGKVTTINGNTFIGQIRWGREEAYWNDLFNAKKILNNTLEHISKEAPKIIIEKNQKQNPNNPLLNLNSDFWDIWADKNQNNPFIIHTFACQFGDIKSIEPLPSSQVLLTMKNNLTFKLNGSGFNDVNTTLKINDYELGVLKMAWYKIKKIEFIQVNDEVEIENKVIHGKLLTVDNQSFTGFVQWDHDERIASDILDGSNCNSCSNTSFKFELIEKIEKSADGSKIYLKNGKSYFFNSSNDVNRSNRGIIITDENIGKIDIPWHRFDKIEFTKAPNSGNTYSSYKMPKGLSGTVKKVNGQVSKGLIIYDFDEAWEFEILQGKNNEIVYNIPFRNIQKVIPKNYKYSKIILKNGKEIVLGEMRDVSELNAGLLIVSDKNKKPEEIPWREIDEIIFD